MVRKGVQASEDLIRSKAGGGGRGDKIGQKRSQTHQERAKSVPEQPKSGQERPKSGPRATKSGQEGSWNDLGAILPHFGAILGSKMCVFAYVLQYFL